LHEFVSHGVAAEYIDAFTDDDEREAMKQRVMTGVTKVVVNIGVMAFGTNWPIISCVIVARNTRNISSWIQMVGRGTRKFPGQKDCIVIYHGANFDDLGRLEGITSWDLNPNETIRERQERIKKAKEVKEKKDITCQNCGYVFKSARACPQCKHKNASKGEKVPIHEAKLERVEPEKTGRRDFYAQLLGYAREHGYKYGWAGYTFRNKYGTRRQGIPSIESGQVLSTLERPLGITRPQWNNTAPRAKPWL
jgi:superfamily II DNA or RNA helicase